MRATRGGLGAHSIVPSPTVCLYVRSRSERGGFESQALQAGPAPPTGHGSAWKETIDHEPGSRKHPGAFAAAVPASLCFADCASREGNANTGVRQRRDARLVGVPTHACCCSTPEAATWAPWLLFVAVQTSGGTVHRRVLPRRSGTPARDRRGSREHLIVPVSPDQEGIGETTESIPVSRDPVPQSAERPDDIRDRIRAVQEKARLNRQRLPRAGKPTGRVPRVPRLSRRAHGQAGKPLKGGAR